MSGDPESARALALARRIGQAQASDAEREELDLLVSDRPDLKANVDAEIQRWTLGQGWLERVEADKRLAQAEKTPLARLERGAGLGLVVAGVVTMPLLPAFSGPAMLAGVSLLLWSFVRVKLKTLKDDPYRNVDR